MIPNVLPEAVGEIPNEATLRALRELGDGDSVTVENMDEYRKIVDGAE